MYEITKQYHFSAAHALRSLPPGHKCHNFHGHNYVVEICLSGSRLDDHGMLIDFADIDWVIKPLIDSLDHKNLNELFEFATTSENLAHWFFNTVNTLDIVAKGKKEKAKYVRREPSAFEKAKQERIMHIKHRYLPLRWLSVSETPKTKAIWRAEQNDSNAG